MAIEIALGRLADSLHGADRGRTNSTLAEVDQGWPRTGGFALARPVLLVVNICNRQGDEAVAAAALALGCAGVAAAAAHSSLGAHMNGEVTITRLRGPPLPR